MATHLRLDHEYRCDADTFWDRVFFDDEYNESLYLRALKFPKYEKLTLEDRGGTIFRRIGATPPQEAPAAIQKLLGGELRYTEEGTFDKSTKRFRFQTIPSKLADKVSIMGTIYATPAGENRIRRIVEVDIAVKIFGLGGMVESFVAKMIKESFERGARFTNDFLQKKGMAASP